MKKAELLFLGKVFEKEIDGGFLQSKSKIAEKLEAEGYLQKTERTYGSGWSTVTCEGYNLTISGHYTYCKSCEDIDDK